MLINIIFEPKGWTTAESLPTRLEKYGMFMKGHARTDFMSFQKKARSEFCELHGISKRDNNHSIKLITNQDGFLSWLKGPKVLKKLGYLGNINSSPEEIEECYESAIIDYENAIMFYCGEKLWKNAKNSFNEHKKYYSTVIRKPFSMSIVDFNDRMREYGNMLSFLQPPTRK